MWSVCLNSYTTALFIGSSTEGRIIGTSNPFYRTCVLLNLYRVSIPFFFEPNFDAHVKPLAGALRIQDGGDQTAEIKLKESVVYGDFLLKKVGNNFSKYDN